MKGKLLTLGAATLMLVSLAGVSSCSSGKMPDVNFVVPEAGFDTTKEVEINFYHTMGKNLQEVFDMYLEDFNDIYPNIKVKQTSIGAYNDVRDQMTTELSSKRRDGANIAYCYPDHVAMYNKAKAVVVLDNLINDHNLGFSDEELNDFIDAYYEEGKSFGDGKMYSLPFSKSSEVLYYNKTFLDAHNLQVPTHWFTKDEADVTSMEYVCKEIKKVNSDVIPLGYDSAANWFITMCEQNGWGYTSANDPHYLFNNAGTKSFLEELNGYYDKGLVTTQADYGAYTSNLFAKGVEGGCIYCIGSSGGASYQKPATAGAFEVGVAPIPGSKVGADVNKAVISQGPSLVMLQCGRAKDKDLKAKMTFLFIKELMDPAFQAEFSIASGYNPVRVSTFDIDAYADHLAGDSMTALAAACATTMTDDFYTSPAFVGSSTARTQVGNALVFAMTGQKTAEKALQDAYKNCGGK